MSSIVADVAALLGIAALFFCSVLGFVALCAWGPPRRFQPDAMPWHQMHCEGCGVGLDLYVREERVDSGAICSARCRRCR